MQNAGLQELKLESRLLEEISITSDMQMIPPLWQKAKRKGKINPFEYRVPKISKER